LGIKGTLSVVELKTLKFRLQQGREAKAKRGELGRLLAPGYVTDPAGQMVNAPNLRVQEAIDLVFRKFRQLDSVHQTHRWFHEETIELPVNKGGQSKLAWQLPTVSFIIDALQNPLYAGAYVYGH
jgi:DNA invertase Pin-like site-specific DNA recombinase